MVTQAALGQSWKLGQRLSQWVFMGTPLFGGTAVRHWAGLCESWPSGCKPTSAPCKVIIAGPASPDAGCLPHCRQLSFLAQKWDLVALSSGPLQGGLWVCVCVELANVSSVHLSSAFLLTQRALEPTLPHSSLVLLWKYRFFMVKPVVFY